MDKLVQVHRQNTRTLILNERGINYTIEKGEDIDEVFIPYEDVLGERLAYSSAEYKKWIEVVGYALVGCALLLIVVKFNVVSIILGIGLAMLAEFFLVMRKRARRYFWKIRLDEEHFLYVHQAIPSSDEVDQFLERLEQKRKRYLLKEYAYLHPELSYAHQLTNLKWLKKMGVLNKKDFVSKMRILERYFPADDVFLDYFGEDEGSLN